MTSHTTPTATVATALGPITITPTRAAHVHVEVGKAGGFAVRGVKLRGSLHLGCYDGEWALLRDEQGRTNAAFAVYLYRADDPLVRASVTGRDKAIEAVRAAVREWAKANDAVLVAAQRQHVAGEIGRRLVTIADHVRAIRALRAEIAAIRKTGRT